MAQEQATQDPADSAHARGGGGSVPLMEQYVVELPSEDLKARIASATASAVRTIYVRVVVVTALVAALITNAA